MSGVLPASYVEMLNKTWENLEHSPFYSAYKKDMRHTHSYGKEDLEYRTPENDFIYFWKRHGLFKTLEKDEDGVDRIMYSIVKKGTKIIDGGDFDLSSSYATNFISFLDPEIFYEVGENRYELLIEEEDLPQIIKIENPV